MSRLFIIFKDKMTKNILISTLDCFLSFYRKLDLQIARHINVKTAKGGKISPYKDMATSWHI